MYQSRSRTGRWRSRFLTLGVVLAVIFPTASAIYLAQVTYPVQAEAQTVSLPGTETVNLPWPGQGSSAVGAVGYGLLADSGNADQPVPIASITKVFTALAVLEKKPLAPGTPGETITITPHDVMLYHDYAAQGGSVVPVSVGQQLTQRDAMYALLLPSANNIADTLVVWAFGSMNEYLAYANRMVDQMGLTQTILADASGFAPGSVSSPQDLIVAGEALASHPLLAEIVSDPVVSLPGTGTLYNTNKLLGTEGIIGAKTGNTDEAGDCLLSLAKHAMPSGETVIIVGVVLGQPDRTATFSHTRSLLSAAKKGFETVKAIKAGTVVGHYQTPWNIEVPLVADQDVTVVRWRNMSLTPEIHLEEATSGLPAGQEVGSIVVQNGADPKETTVSLKAPLDPPSLWWRATHLSEL